jgi:hypothetical protein
MKAGIGILAVLAVVVAGCSTPEIITSWKTKELPQANYKKIMVLGLIRETDRTLQHQMENHLVGDLTALGYKAVSALEEYGPKFFDNLNETEAISKIQSGGIDAVITVVLLDKEKERTYQPGRLYYSPYAGYYHRFWGYRTVLYGRIYEPGYYISNTRYFWESNLYNMSNQQLIYSVQTQAFNPASLSGLSHEYGQMIVKDMVKKGVLLKNRDTFQKSQ